MFKTKRAENSPGTESTLFSIIQLFFFFFFFFYQIRTHVIGNRITNLITGKP